MNPELPHLTREEIEVRLTALLLGELPPAEAGAMLQLVANDPALGQLLARLKQTIGLIRAAAIAPSEEAAAPAAPRQIAPERREKLLNHFKLPTPRQLGIPPLPPQRKPFRWLVPALVCLTAVVIMVGLFLPALGSAKMKAQRLSASRVLSLEQGMEERTVDKYITAANVSPAFSGEPATPAVMPPPATPLPVPPPPADSPVLAVATHGVQVAGIVAPTTPAERPVTDESITSGLRGGGSGGGGFGGGRSATPSSGIAAAGKPGGAPGGNRSVSDSWFDKAAEKESLGREAKAKANVFSTNVIRFADTRLPAGGKPAAPAGIVSGTSTLAVNGGDLYGGVSDKAPALAVKDYSYFGVNGPSGSAGDQLVVGKRVDRFGVSEPGKAEALKPAQAGDERVAGEKVVADAENRPLGWANADAIGVLEAKSDSAFRNRYAYVVPPTKSADGDLSGLALKFDDEKAGATANQWGFDQKTKEVAESSANLGAAGIRAFGRSSDGAVDFQARLGDAVRGAEVGGPKAKLALDETRGSDVTANAIRLPMPTLKGTPAELPAGGKNVESLAETAAKEAAHWVEIQNSVAAFDTPARPRTVGNLELSLNRKLAKAEPAKDLNFIFKLGEERQFSEEKPASTTSPAKPSSGPVTGLSRDDTAAFSFLADANGSVPANQPASVAGQVPVLGDVPMVGRLFRSESQQSAEKAVTTERLEERRDGRDQDTDQAQKKLASLEAQVGQKVEAKAIEEKKRELDQLVNVKQQLQLKAASEGVDMNLPKTAMVEIIDPATPPTKPKASVWERMRGAVNGDRDNHQSYQSTARIKVANGDSDISPMPDKRDKGSAYDPYFVQTESEVIQSKAVLDKVIERLKLDEAWTGKYGEGRKLSRDETYTLLKAKLDLRSTKDTGLLEIAAKSDKPQEAADIANAVAEAYSDYRRNLQRQMQVGGIQILNEELAKKDTQIAEVQQELARLKPKDEKVVEAEPPPPPKPSAGAPVPQPEVVTAENPFSTFSLNVADVSFKLAQASLEKGVMPEAASIRSEEFINAFDYRDPEPAPGAPIAFAWERSRYPFAHNRDALRFSVKTAAAGRAGNRPLNLVLLLDNSGSMERADRVQIIREALRVLATQLQPQDKVSVVAFARTARLWVDGLPGSQAGELVDRVGNLTPQGGTNLEDAMAVAYRTALGYYMANGMNRVVLLTDGAANLGDVSPASLKEKVEHFRKQGIALDCFGIGWEGYNDDLLETLSRNGDGRYGFVNTPEAAATEFAAQLAGALQVAASDVKVQVEFNPARVTAYRQVGYAKHQLTKEQFRDNTVDAAEIAAAEAGNGLYVIEANPQGQGAIATVRVRYKVPGTSDYREQEWPVPYTGNAVALEQASPALRLAATASAFSEWLVSSPYAGEVTPDRLLGYLGGVPEVYGADARPRKLEWMIRQAKSIAGK